MDIPVGTEYLWDDWMITQSCFFLLTPGEVNFWNQHPANFGGFSCHPVVKILVLDYGWFVFPRFRGEHLNTQLPVPCMKMPVSPVSTLKHPLKKPWVYIWIIDHLRPRKTIPPLPQNKICLPKINPQSLVILWGFSDLKQGWSVLILLSTSWGCAPPSENASDSVNSSSARPWKWAVSQKGKDRLPTIHFQVQFVSFKECIMRI